MKFHPPFKYRPFIQMFIIRHANSTYERNKLLGIFPIIINESDERSLGTEWCAGAGRVATEPPPSDRYESVLQAYNKLISFTLYSNTTMQDLQNFDVSARI